MIQKGIKATITGSTPQGDANFEGITFEIINNSRNPVMVEGQKYQPGEVVKTLVTDSEGKASTADDLLPYGEYILHESATNESMLLTAPDQTVLVEDDGIVYEFVMSYGKSPPQTGMRFPKILPLK